MKNEHWTLLFSARKWDRNTVLPAQSNHLKSLNTPYGWFLRFRRIFNREDEDVFDFKAQVMTARGAIEEKLYIWQTTEPEVRTGEV